MGPSATPSAIEFTVEGGDAVGLVVDGNSLEPRYQAGDVLIGARQAGLHLDNLIGVECIVETRDGCRLVRFLARGTVRGTYRLRSPNPTVPDVDNARLLWAAPVSWIKRGQR